MTSKTENKQAGSDAQSIADEKARKEEIVEARIRAVREKNEKLMKRQQEIEEDRRNAHKYSDMAVKKHHDHAPSGVVKESSSAGGGRGRARGRGLLLQEMRKETLKAKQFEAKRRENIQQEEQELRNQRSKSSRSNFLLDDNRVDMSRTTGRNERSWGGTNFNQVVNRVQKEKEGFRSDRSRGNIEMTMSGKERREYQQWKEERKQIDEDRKMRQKKEGNWSRAWDQKKSWDPRKKMWVYEDHNDDYNDARRQKQNDDHEDWGNDNRNRRQGHRHEEHRSRQGFVQHHDREMEASEEWGDDNRNSRRDNRGHSREEHRPKQGFVEHDNRNMEASEEWGETGDAVVTHTKVSVQITEADKKFNQQQSAVSNLGGEDWEDETPTPLDSNVKTSVTSIEATSDDVENITPEQPVIEPIDSETNRQFDDSRDLHKEESLTEDPNDQSHSDASKPQREVKQRGRPHDAEENKQHESKDSHEEQESATEESSPVDENSLQKSSISNVESAVTDKEPEQVNKEREAVTDELVKEDGDGKSKKYTVTEDNDKGDLPKPSTEQQVATTQTAEEMKTNQSEDNVSKSSAAKKADLLNDKGDTVPKPTAVQEQQVITTQSAEEVKTVESEDNVSKSPAKKADLPKLITKVDKKVTFDAEEDEHKTEESESKDSRAMSVDIPPTPDFLKVDHSVNWGDFEIDEQEVVERW